MAALPPELSYETARKQGRGLDLNVELRRGKKGVGLFAKKHIAPHTIIAYYVTQIYSASRRKRYAVEYSIGIPKHPNLVGDLCEDSLASPVRLNGRWVPLWAYFSNEPSPDEASNSHLYPAMKGSFAHAKVAIGELYRFKLVASKAIQPGEEIVWCYGDDYERSYASSC